MEAKGRRPTLDSSKRKMGKRNEGEHLSSWLYREIRDRISTCAIRPNTLLVESRLAEEYGVSRTPVREALSLLGREGIVEVLPRVGYRVIPIALKDVHEIFDMRILLEGEAAALAATQGDSSAHAKLYSDQEVWARTSEDVVELGDFIRSHDQFHLAVADLSGNARLESFIGKLLRDGLRLRMSAPVTPERLDEECKDRAALCKTLADRDADAARTIMRSHVLHAKEKALQRLVSGMSQQPQLELL